METVRLEKWRLRAFIFNSDFPLWHRTLQIVSHKQTPFQKYTPCPVQSRHELSLKKVFDILLAIRTDWISEFGRLD